MHHLNADFYNLLIDILLQDGTKEIFEDHHGKGYNYAALKTLADDEVWKNLTLRKDALVDFRGDTGMYINSVCFENVIHSMEKMY